MKKLIILLTFILAGCATKPIIVTPNIVKPEIEIMGDCAEYIKPKVGNTSELLEVIKQNKKIYVDCSKLNNAKKGYIERQLK